MKSNPKHNKTSSHFPRLEKTRARNAAKMIRMGLAAEAPHAGVELLRYWPKLGVKRGVIACYLPIQSEIDCRPLMQALADAGHELALPCIARKHHPLEFRAYTLGDKLRGGAHGTKEPRRAAPLVTPDVVLLPLLAYSRIGARLGYGGGFYDRSLAQLRETGAVFACGLAYAGQEVPLVPTDQYDQGLDGVLTETGFKVF